MDTSHFRVRHGEEISLEHISADVPDNWHGRKAEGKEKLEDLRQQLDGLQERLYAQHKHRLLVVLQWAWSYLTFRRGARL